MEKITLEILRTFFQQIPNGLTLIFAIGSLIACFFILLKKRHRGRFYICFWALVLFMLLWRTVVGVVAVRYVAALIVPAVMLTAFAGLRGEGYWRLLRRKFPVLPRWFGKFISRAVLWGTAAGALLMAHHALSADQDTYQQMFRIVKSFKTAYPDLAVVADRKDVRRFQYYTGAKIIGVEDLSPEVLVQQLNSPAITKEKNVIIILRFSKRKQLQLPVHKLPPGKKLIRAMEITNSGKRKNITVYHYYTVNNNHKSSPAHRSAAAGK